MIVLVAILPPLLYSSAFFTSLRDLRRNARPLALLAVGLGVAALAFSLFLPRGIFGALDGDTPATFRCDAKAGQIWDFSVLAGRAGSALDALLRIRDSRHLSLALAAGNPKIDRHIRFRAPVDGAYYLEITDDQARGGPTFTYVLTAIRR